MITATRLSAGKFAPPKTLKDLRTYLQAALEVEHMTIPVYMTGMYTIRPGTNKPACFTIRSVLLEEMLHMTLAANLLNAVGGTPRLARAGFVADYPARLPFSSAKLPRIGLHHFSPEALETFMTIERPRSMAPRSRNGGWTSIGQFYQCVRDGLVELVRTQGESKVFSGDPRRQVGPEDFYNSGGEVFPVTDLRSALVATRVLTEQGEGAGDTIWDSDDQIFGERSQAGHYFRFNEIYTGRAYSRYDTPRSPEPSGPLLDVTWDDAYRIDGRSKLADYKKHAGAGSDVHRQAVAFNETYAVLLWYLETAFTTHPRVMALAVPAMLELRDRAVRLCRNPHPDPELRRKGCHASPTFEVTQAVLDDTRHQAEQNVKAARLAPGEPVGLSGITAISKEQHS